MKHGPSARQWILMLRRDKDRHDGMRPIVPHTARTVIVPGNTERAYPISVAKVEWIRPEERL